MRRGVAGQLSVTQHQHDLEELTPEGRGYKQAVSMADKSG